MAGITPPSELPDPLNFQSPIRAQPVQTPVPGLPTSPFPSGPPSGLPTSNPQASPTLSFPGLDAEDQPQATGPGENIDLGLDLDRAEGELPPEARKEAAFETIMDSFKNVITTKNKMLSYDFASAIGVEDYIEEFYEFLSKPDKDGIIIYKNDEVVINKTKIMGALMLGDNTILERVMTSFRAWLMKVMK